MKVNQISCCNDCPGRQYEWCTISRNKHDCKKIRNKFIIPKFCPLHNYKQTKIKAWEVSCCGNCKHHITDCKYSNLYNYSTYCSYNDSHKKVNKNTIPSWCPLEDYKRE